MHLMSVITGSFQDFLAAETLKEDVVHEILSVFTVLYTVVEDANKRLLARLAPLWLKWQIITQRTENHSPKKQ